MYRFLIRPAWLALELLTLVVVVVFLLLGRWQYDSARQVAAAVAPPTAAAARPITTWIPDGTNLAAADLGRAVTLTGTFDPASQRIVPGQVRDGRTGSWVVTLLRPTPAAAAVLVARGWIPAGAAAPAPPTGTVHVLGWLGGAQDPGLAAGTLLVAPLDLPAMSPALLANQVSYPVSDGFVGQTAIQELSAAGRQAGTALLTVGLPAGGVTWDWQNVGYAVQWVFFAAGAVGVLGYGARREAQGLAVTDADLRGRTELRL